MRKYIHKHLDEKYYVATSPVGNYGIYPLADKDDVNKYPEYGDTIIKEVVTIFSIEKEEAKLEIHLWAHKKNDDTDLDFYWKSHATPLNIGNLIFPIAQRISATTIGHDLVPVQSMSMPKMDLVYLDFIHNKPWYKKLWDNFKGFFKKKPKKKFMRYGVLNHDTRKNQWLEQYSAMHLAQQNEL
jgi:hypothetical protein